MPGPPSLRRFDPRRALGRASAAVASGLLVALALSTFASPLVSVLAGWDFAGLVLVALAWSKIVGCDAAETERRAASEDPGRTAVYVVVLVTSMGSLFAATVLSRMAKALASSGGAPIILVLCIVSVALSWALTHTAFTLRYAHLYYREDDAGVGGLELPGGAKPTYSDFAYFAFTIGMTFQVSDVTVTARSIRRAVLLHAVISFLYNTVILAFTMNLMFAIV